MIYVIKFIYSWFLVPGIFIVCLLLLSLWLGRKKQSAAKVLAVITVVLYLFSTGYVSGMLLRSLESQYFPPETVSGDAVIILCGGATSDTPNLGGQGHLSGPAANRVLTGVSLARQLNVPVVLAGGQVYSDTGNEAQITKRILQDLGVPESQIFIENQSLNTRQNAENTKKILDESGFKNPILVTSASHMKRSVFYFSQAGVAVTPYPTDYQVNVVQQFGNRHFTPSAGALEDTSVALKEYIGLAAAAWANY